MFFFIKIFGYEIGHFIVIKKKKSNATKLLIAQILFQNGESFEELQKMSSSNYLIDDNELKA